MGQFAEFYAHGLAYAQGMGDHPQTLYALEDSPVGLAAWMLDHDARSLSLIAHVFDGRSEDFNEGRHPGQRHALLADEDGRLMGAPVLGERAPFFAPKASRCRPASARSPTRSTPPREWAEQAYPNLVHFNRLPKGGHFAAWEQPAFFSEELRATFRSLR